MPSTSYAAFDAKDIVSANLLSYIKLRGSGDDVTASQARAR